MPVVKMGIVAVGRDCFPTKLSNDRREMVVKAYKGELYNFEKVVETESDVLLALDALAQNGVNALVIYLGNFGPEACETMLAQKFGGPTMFVAAAEEKSSGLIAGRGDAYCGMLNASYNLNLRNIKAYIPENPTGTFEEVAKNIADFSKIARALVGIKKLKIMSFGPRPENFLACNAPIKPLFDLGVEIQENSELDLFASFNAHKNDERIASVMEDMKKELGEGNKFPAVLDKLAQYELTLLDWYKNNLGASEFGVIAGKCWPAFQTEFGFVPCYVNGRLASQGIPVSCETDIYGALTQYIIGCVTDEPSLLLDINNTVPADMAKTIKGYKNSDLFMGFHCGNGSTCLVKKPTMKYQRIMHSLLEPDSEPNISRGTLEGDIKSGKVTVFRVQSSADCKLKSYIAEGEVLDTPTQSFGTIGIIAIDEMARFYRHVLIEKNYPHHAGIAQGHVARLLFEVVKFMGIDDIGYNQPASLPYKNENVFKG